MESEIVQVIPTENYTVYIYFDDGYVRLYNANELIKRGGIFNKLKDKKFFIERCTILNNTLAWDITGNYDEFNCIDICPDTLKSCPIVENIEEIEKELFLMSV